MSVINNLKETLKDTRQDIDEVKHSFAWEICVSLARTNKRLYIICVLEGLTLLITLLKIFLG